MNAFYSNFEKKFGIKDMKFFMFLLDLENKFNIRHSWILEFLETSSFEDKISYIIIEDIHYICFNKEIFAKLKPDNKWGCHLEPSDEPILKKFVAKNTNYIISNGKRKLLV